jgi:quercetin dioxygenase-like cupin family protein
VHALRELVDALDRAGAGPAASGDGVHWTLEADGDLNANLVHLDGGSEVATHRNDEVDVAVVVLGGAGALGVDGEEHRLERHVVAAVPKGTSRRIAAGGTGLTYLTVHRRRGGLGISSRPPRAVEDVGGESACFAHLLDAETGAMPDREGRP